MFSEQWAALEMAFLPSLKRDVFKVKICTFQSLTCKRNPHVLHVFYIKGVILCTLFAHEKCKAKSRELHDLSRSCTPTHKQAQEDQIRLLQTNKFLPKP